MNLSLDSVIAYLLAAMRRPRYLVSDKATGGYRFQAIDAQAADCLREDLANHYTRPVEVKTNGNFTYVWPK